MSSHQARRDLKDKLVFERQLMRKLNALSRRIARKLISEFANGKKILRAEEFREELEAIIFIHYKRVAKEFSRRLTEDMPKKIAVTEEERKVIDDALNIYFLSLAGEQAHLITKVTQVNIDAAFAEAQEQSNEDDLIKAFTPVQLAVIAATNLVRKLSGRSTTIAAYETQISSEVSKVVEGQVLSGQSPSVTTGSRRKAKVKKEWVTMGDEKVRDAHVGADSQVRDVNEPFDVGGEQLMFPGDTSLGASAGNVINCRCASVINKTEVYAARRDKDELLESIRESL